MKKITVLKGLAVFIALAFFEFLIMSFYESTFDSTKWSNASRGGCTGMLICTLFICAVGTAMNYFDKEQ